MNKLLISTLLKINLNEAFIDQTNKLQSFDKNDVAVYNMLSPDALKTLKNEYSNFYIPKFDWNEKQSELGDKMGDWLESNANDGFIKNIDRLIYVTTQDLVTRKRKKLASQKLAFFEELILPSLGREVLTPQITKYVADAILDPNATAESIAKAYRETKNILDVDGSVNFDKVNMSTLFSGDQINEPAFEKYINSHPEYRGVFNTWKKLSDEETEWVLKDLNAFRDSTPSDKISKLNTELRQIKKHLK